MKMFKDVNIARMLLNAVIVASVVVALTSGYRIIG